MYKSTQKIITLTCLLAGLATAPAFGQGAGTIMRLEYDGIGGGLNDLIVNAKFPFAPDIVDYRTTFEFLGYGDAKNDWGQWMIGFLTPTNSGTYYFAVASDDGSEFWLSTDENPANRQLLSSNSRWAGQRSYNELPFQQSKGVQLEAGKPYWIECLMKEGGGGDPCTVAWGTSTPIANGTLGIPGTFLRSSLATGAAAFRAEPVSTTKQEGASAKFEALFTGNPPYDYQWVVNGALVGAPGKTYRPQAEMSFSGLTVVADDGKTVSIVVTNASGFVVSSNAVLSVIADTNKPVATLAVGTSQTNTSLTVKFSEAVQAVPGTGASDYFNYNLNNGTTVSAAVLEADGKTVTLTLDISVSALTNGATLTVGGSSDILDLAGNIAPASMVLSVVVNDGLARQQFYDPAKFGDPPANSLAVFPFKNFSFMLTPDQISLVPTLEWKFASIPGVAMPNRYGGRAQALVTAPETANFYFWTGGDGNTAVYLSTDENPANKYLISSNPDWSGDREWNKFWGQKSGGQPLVAGRKYYIEVVHKAPDNGNGNAHLSWNTTGTIVNDADTPISGLYLSSYNEAIVINPNLPLSLATNACGSGTLSVQVTAGSPTVMYQWYSTNGTAIVDATNSTYVLPLPLVPNAYYAVIANSANTVTSRVAAVDVAPYLTGPHIKAVSSVNQYSIYVQFDQGMSFDVDTQIFDWLSWAVDSGGSPMGVINVTNVLGRNDYFILQLDTTSPPLATDFIVTAPVDLKNCTSMPIEADGISKAGKRWALGYNIDLAANPTPGTNYTTKEGEIEVVAGGNDIWGTSDQFYFVANEVTGDFDVKVQVTRLDPTSRWAKAGLDARESLAANSKHIMSVMTPFGPTNPKNQGDPGADGVDVGARNSTGGNTDGWGGGGSPSLSAGYSWLRLRRVGDTFTAFRATDGLTWQVIGGPNTVDYPDTVFLGLATSSHNNTANTKAIYANYGPFFYPGAQITFVGPASVTTGQGTKTTLSAVATVANAPQSELAYQWQRGDGVGGFTNVPGATLSSLATGWLTVADDNGSQYQVIGRIPGLSVTSLVATVTVTNSTAAPKLLYAVGLNPTNVAAFFSAPMSASVADEFAWGFTSGGIGVFSATVNGTNGAQVDLVTTVMAVGTSYTITNGTAQDINGNTVSPNPGSATFVALPDFVGTYANPQAANPLAGIMVLPTVNMLPYGSLALRGFDSRLVQTTNGIANDNDTTELLLAGTWTTGWPAYRSQGPNMAGVPNFVECGAINYNWEASQLGHITPDKPFPGIPNTNGTYQSTDNFVMEALAYLELRAGLYRFNVNSDDGFRVSPATNVLDPNNAIVLGSFNGGRGSQDSMFDVSVPVDGLYPFRLTYQEGGGGANVEFDTYNLVTGQWLAVNAEAGVHAYRPSGVGTLPPVLTAPTVTVRRNADGSVTACWPAPAQIAGDTCNSVIVRLQGTDALANPSSATVWTDLPTATVVTTDGVSCITTPAGPGNLFVRVVFDN